MQDNNNLLEVIINNLDELIFLIDSQDDYKIIKLNENLSKKILGYSQKHLVNKSILSIIHSQDRENVKNMLKQEGVFTSINNECRIKSESGKYIWFEFNKSRLNNPNTTILVFLRQIETEKILKKKIEDYEEKLKELTELIPEIRFWRLFSPKKFEEALRNSYEMLESVIESIPQYIAWKDLNLEYLGCNKNFAELVGIGQPENIIKKKDRDIFWFRPKKISHYKIQEKKVLKTNQPQFNIVEDWTLEDKSHCWVNINRIPLHDSKRKVVGILITYEDITTRKIADKKLEESEKKYRHLFDNSPNMIVLVDTEGIFIDVNKSFLEFTGYNKDTVIGKTFNELNAYEKNLKLYKKYLKLIIKKGQIGPIEIQLENEENELKWHSAKAYVTEIENQKLIHIIMEDIHERKLSQNKIKESEKRYKDLIETSSVGIIELDLRNKEILYINPKLLQILGYDTAEEEIINSEEIVSKIIQAKDYERILRASDEEDLEFQIPDKAGKLKWLSGKKVTHYTQPGELISFRLWLEDVTEKKMYEKILYELNINFLNFTMDVENNIYLLLNNCNKLLNSAVVLYAFKDEQEEKEKEKEKEKDEYTIISSEKEYMEIDSVEFSKSYFASKLFLETHDFPQLFLNLNESKFQKSDPYIKKYGFNGFYGRLLKTDDDLKGCICAYYPENPTISYHDQYTLFLTSVALDIEIRRWEAQKHLEKQNIVLSDISKLKTELLSRTSHELKTPLISIKGFTELLLTVHKSKLDEDIISILLEIKNGSNRLERIINSLLEGSKLEQGKLVLNRQKEDLAFLIKYCINEIKGLIDLRNQKLKLHIENKLITKFDKERIYEVLSNILINAIKYTPPNGKISISSKIENGFYTISIQDNGIGITEEEKERIFKQFGKIERYGKGWDIDVEGTGLGLYISKKIIELHGGTIWVESEGRNKGSIFFFTLPILP